MASMANSFLTSGLLLLLAVSMPPPCSGYLATTSESDVLDCTALPPSCKCVQSTTTVRCTRLAVKHQSTLLSVLPRQTQRLMLRDSDIQMQFDSHTNNISSSSSSKNTLNLALAESNTQVGFIDTDKRNSTSPSNNFNNQHANERTDSNAKIQFDKNKNNIITYHHHFDKLKHLTIIDSKLNTSLINQGFTAFPNLKILDITGTNLKNISAMMLNGLQMLTNVNLRDNAIEKVDKSSFLGSCETLESIDLSNNFIYRLPPNVFHNLSALLEIRLTNNFMDFIHPDIFVDLNNLQSIHLEFNRLQGLQSELLELPSLEEVYIHGNPLDCNCGLEWLLENVVTRGNDTVSGKSVIKDVDKIVCHTPHLLAQLPVNKLTGK